MKKIYLLSISVILSFLKQIITWFTYLNKGKGECFEKFKDMRFISPYMTDDNFIDRIIIHCKDRVIGSQWANLVDHIFIKAIKYNEDASVDLDIYVYSYLIEIVFLFGQFKYIKKIIIDNNKDLKIYYEDKSILTIPQFKGDISMFDVNLYDNVDYLLRKFRWKDWKKFNILDQPDHIFGDKIRYLMSYLHFLNNSYEYLYKRKILNEGIIPSSVIEQGYKVLLEFKCIDV